MCLPVHPQTAGIGAVVMAAGAGRRMGGLAKSLLRRDGETLLLRQVRLATEAGAARIVVVLGHHAQNLRAVLREACVSAASGMRRPGLSWVVNPEPDAGAGSSLRCGLRALGADVSTWLVMLADQPLLEARDVRMIVNAWQARAHGIELVVPVHGGQPGHPLAFGEAVRLAVLRARGGQGVREWRRMHPRQVATLPVSHARYACDVDTPADVARLHAEHGVRLEWPPAV